MISIFEDFSPLGVLDRFSDFSCFQGRIFAEQLFMQHCHFGHPRIGKKKKKSLLRIYINVVDIEICGLET